MTTDIDRLHKAYAIARDLLIARCGSENGGPAHWTGELSTSPLSTATAVMALEQVRKAGRSAADFGLDVDFDQLIRGGLDWLAGHQNEDGGWGDTVKSISNISTTMLSHAVFHATGTTEAFSGVVDRAKLHIDAAGGVPAVVARYGKDKTFSIPILTHCALAGLVEWKDITPLPFELSVLPARFYKAVRLPVVSYALPALIAIGQVRHHFCPTWNPLTRILRNAAIKRSLRVLERIQPPNGGFLEAAPLTSFVTMSLAGKGLADHVVVKRAVGFLCESVRPDGSWPIDTNLATWVTTLSINALKGDVPEELRPGLIEWLLDQQYNEVHPYTNADPGGWAWTDLPGGVPDGDDTPGAMLALHNLVRSVEQREAHQPEAHSGDTAGSPSSESGIVGDEQCQTSRQWHPVPPSRRHEAREDDEFGDPLGWFEIEAPAAAAEIGILWLLDLQNNDGGFPTFCRGWGTLPFDRSSPDITAHCIRAITGSDPWVARRVQSLSDLMRKIPFLVTQWLDVLVFFDSIAGFVSHLRMRGFSRNLKVLAVLSASRFLRRTQRPDGSWLPLWFGNQLGHDDGNPVYGTSRVLMAYRDLQLTDAPEAQRAAAWLASIQEVAGPKNGPLGGTAGSPGSEVEPETEHCRTSRQWAPASSGDTADDAGGPREARPTLCETDDSLAPSSTLGPQLSALNPPRGWGGDAGIEPSVEETALAAEVLLEFDQFRPNAIAGIEWLIDRVEDGSVSEPSPIGFYFARLWYFEELYPLIFAVSALRRAVEVLTDGDQ